MTTDRPPQTLEECWRYLRGQVARLKESLPLAPEGGFDWPWTFGRFETMGRPSAGAKGLDRKLGQMLKAPTLERVRQYTEEVVREVSAGLDECQTAFTFGHILLLQAHLLAACVHLTHDVGPKSARAGGERPPRFVVQLGVSLIEGIHCLHVQSSALVARVSARLPPAPVVSVGASVGGSALAAVSALAAEVMNRYYYTSLDVALHDYLDGCGPKGDRRFACLARRWREACPALHGRLPDTMDTKRAAALLTAESRLVAPCKGSRLPAAPGGARRAAAGAAASAHAPARRGSARKGAARPRGPGGVRLGNSWEEPALVRGRAKALRSYRELKVLRALQEAGAEGLKKDALESVASDARRILRRLIEDADWCAVIRMPRTKGNRYRLLAEQ